MSSMNSENIEAVAAAVTDMRLAHYEYERAHGAYFDAIRPATPRHAFDRISDEARVVAAKEQVAAAQTALAAALAAVKDAVRVVEG